MTFAEFINTLSAGSPSVELHPLLKALWHDANGGWTLAHGIVQEIDGTDAAWVHAYLHRKEGDLSNAAYWYRRAAKEASKLPLEEEWGQIARALLKASS